VAHQLFNIASAGMTASCALAAGLASQDQRHRLQRLNGHLSNTVLVALSQKVAENAEQVSRLVYAGIIVISGIRCDR
jgi:hypothetical protein